MALDKNKRIIIYIVIVIIGFISYSYYYVSKNRQALKKDWNKIRCKPHIIPFAGLISDEGAYDNFLYCYFGWIKHFFKMFTQPLIYIFKVINKNFRNILIIINNFRKQAVIMRSLFRKFVLNTAERIQKSHMVIQFYKAKLADVLKKQQALFLIYRYFGQAQMITVRSLVNGPLPEFHAFLKKNRTHFKWLMDTCTTCVKSFVGNPTAEERAKGAYACPGCFGGSIFCFDEDTEIKMRSGKYKKICEIELDDFIETGGKVLSFMKFNITQYNDIDMYYYKDTIVSGNHIVFEDDKPILVKNSKVGIKISYDKPYLYSLITQNNLIKTKNNVVFCDDYECSNMKVNLINNRLILKTINNTENIDRYADDINHLYVGGIDENTYVCMNDNTYKKIKNVSMTDILKGNNKVNGKIYNSTYGIRIFKYKNNIISGSQLIFEDNKWIRCHQSKESKEIFGNYKTISLVVNNNNIYLKNDVIIRDYNEIHPNNEVFDKICFNNINSLK